MAQVISDGSLRSNVTGCPANCLITGGASAGNNLFHGFSQFAIPTGGLATFEPQPGISRIFGRVTGGDRSQIDGELRVNGGADLFLINPSGIQFGPNARLNLTGSFIGTTAQTIDFGGGEKFGVGTNSLLSIKVPVGLEIYGNRGNIRVDGIAPPLPLAGDPRFTPTVGAGTSAGLSTPGKTLGLVGNGITLNQATLTGANIGLHSSNGYVSLTSAPTGYTFTGDRTANLSLNNLSRVDASQQPTSQIALSASHLAINEGSQVLIQSLSQPPGKIDVAAERLDIQGLNGVYASRIVSEHFGLAGAAIAVNAGDITLTDGGQISTRSYGPGDSGAITINSEALTLSNPGLTNPQNNQHAIIIASGTQLVGGGAGPVDIRAKAISLKSGGAIAGQHVSVQGKTIDLDGALVNGQPSAIFSSVEVLGKQGQIDIQAKDLTIQNRAIIGSNTSSLEQGANINIQTENLTIAGILTAENPEFNATGIASVAGNPLFNRVFGRTPGQYGRSGDLNITANTIDSRLGILSTANQGTGAAGTVFVRADRAKFNSSLIYSTALQGNGGGIEANIGLLQVSRSQFLVNSDGSGLGGNVVINANVLIAQQNLLIASSQGNRGGRVQANIDNFFTDRQSLVSVTSALGPEFTGQYVAPAVNDNNFRSQSLVTSLDKSPELAQQCPGHPGTGSSLIDATNSINPNQHPILGAVGWRPKQGLSPPPSTQQPSAYQDAQGWHSVAAAKGRWISLTADVSIAHTTSPKSHANCR
jgi:filamentous hemagglutinin family protein